ncbi:MAG: hypothetical protein K0Q79_1184 [Flavipsychrobacter sp.]|jgi:beta-lactamase class A|nr:hypothetical protein [Flavipsychrobacter sp.]
MRNIKIHLSYSLSIIVLGALAYYFISNGRSATVSEDVAKVPVVENNHLKLTTQKGYSFIQPLLKANQESESEELKPLKIRVANIIDDNSKTGILSGASIYLFSLSDGKWMYINPDEKCHPGSLMKMPMLLTYLREADRNPEILNKKYSFSSGQKVPAQTFTSSMRMEAGRPYTVKELLRYMAAYSDNNATKILNENANVPEFVRTFTDLNMAEPNVSDRYYEISAKNASEFLLVLYYATYISKSNSEFAMQLLSECDFKEGIVKGLPANVKVAHKFGEWGDNRVNVHEMHEVAVVYLQDKPYLLTVVTKGSNSKDLANIISTVSKTVYDELASASHL